MNETTVIAASEAKAKFSQFLERARKIGGVCHYAICSHNNSALPATMPPASKWPLDAAFRSRP
jgi:hypothetical protein